MKNLQLKRLHLLSDLDCSANQFEFSNRFNLITADDNSVGKSTLAKMLLWVFGCDPELDDAWKLLDCKGLIEFSIGNVNYRVARHGNLMFFAEGNGELVRYPKITGEFSRVISELVNFKPLLPNKKNNNVLEIPPPAYYFLPFYVDQKRGWTKLWDGFNNLQQFSRWHNTIIRYHTGYLTEEFFEFEEKLALKRAEKLVVSDEIKKIETTLEIVGQYFPVGRPEFAITFVELDFMSSQIEVDLTALQNDQERIFSELADLQVEGQYLQSQLELVKVASEELELDYVFSVERIYGESIQCPLCGVIHDSSLAERASILVDKDQAKDQAIVLERKFKINTNKISSLKNEVELVRDKINSFNIRYSTDDMNSENGASIVDCLAAKSIEGVVFKSKNENILKEKEIGKVERKIKQDQKNILNAEKIEELNNFFKDKISKYVEQLKATGVNLTSVSSPLDYKKLLGGGAAEGARGALAYLMATIQQIYKSSNEVCAPFIVDTPNQQEQAGFNYERIISFLLKETPATAQIFLCAMNSPLLLPYVEKAKVIELGEDKIFQKSKYAVVRPLFYFLEK
ncbi:MAG: hypothetical protein NT086_13435 [Proteobacteria bacterium]|nr:hypothetical protein [Pseudomonadota bacterium]